MNETRADLDLERELQMIATDVRGHERADFDRAFTAHGWRLLSWSMTHDDVQHGHVRVRGLTSSRSLFDLVGYYRNTVDTVTGEMVTQWWELRPRRVSA